MRDDRSASGREPEPEATYSMAATARATGVSPDRLRAWERRHGVVAPVRTAGGTRRYRASDLVRLRLLKAAVDAGDRIGDLAGADVSELERLAARRAPELSPVAATLAALDRLDGAEAERLASLQLAALGPVRFALDFALPLLGEIGSAWEGARLCVASEHLGTALIRTLLGAALRSTPVSRSGPPVVFATPPGERHEIGLLAAAVVALGAGAGVLYLGPDVPLEEIARAASATGAGAVALSLVALAPAAGEERVSALRARLGDEVELWIGGPGAAGISLPPGVHRLDDAAALERRATLLGLRRLASVPA